MKNCHIKTALLYNELNPTNDMMKKRWTNSNLLNDHWVDNGTQKNTIMLVNLFEPYTKSIITAQNTLIYTRKWPKIKPK